MLVSIKTPLPVLDAVSFLGCRECVSRPILEGYMWQPLTFSEEMRVGCGARIP